MLDLFGGYVGILIYFGNFKHMLEMFGDPSSGFHQLIFDAARAISCYLFGSRWKHVDFQAFLCIFYPSIKIEAVDPINLEPQKCIKLRKHKVT